MLHHALILLFLAAPLTSAFPCDVIGGCTGNALRCANGEGVRVPFAVQNQFGIYDFTIECWFQAQPAATAMGLLSKTDPNGTRLSIEIDSDDHIVFTVKNTDGYTARIVSRVGFLDGQWHHLAAMRSQGEVDLYVDESLEGSSPFPAGSTIANDSDLLIGATQTGHGLVGFTGRLDEVRIWGNAIRADSLACLRYSRLTGDEQNLQAYYPFDDSLVRRITCDRSVNHNDGTLGTATDISNSTRTVPPSFMVLEDSLRFVPPSPFSDSSFATLHVVGLRSCGVMLRSGVMSGADAQSFSCSRAFPATIAMGETLSISFLALLTPATQHAVISILSNGCPDAINVALTADTAMIDTSKIDTTPHSVDICINSQTIRAGDTVDIPLFCHPAISSTAGDTLVLRIFYDANQLGLLGVQTTCGIVTLLDSPKVNSATLISTGCNGFPDGTFATLRVVALAPWPGSFDSIWISVRMSPAIIQSNRCAASVTIVPRCATPGAVYSSILTTLSPVSPNPLVGAGSIRFTLQEAVPVRITLFDLFGRRVATLLDQFLMPGTHAVAIDASTLQLQPGTYCTIMTAGTFHGAQRITVMR